MALKSVSYNNNIFDISYEIFNPNAKKNIIILHGWGSNKDIMKGSFSKYMDDFRHIYIDLPGFGKSTCDVELYSEDVAEIIEIFLKLLNIKKDIVVGHSFGGKIATLLNPDMLVLLSSAGIYREKSFQVKSKIYIFKVLKMLGLARFRSVFVAKDAKTLNEVMYKTFKNVVDEDYSDKFSSYKGRTLICWGEEDTATPIDSGKEINKLIDDSLFIVYEGDHFFFTKHSQDISQKIKDTFYLA
jgi:pimeloyl-ACP methyl ester carboxylesterase